MGNDFERGRSKLHPPSLPRSVPNHARYVVDSVWPTVRLPGSRLPSQRVWLLSCWSQRSCSTGDAVSASDDTVERMWARRWSSVGLHADGVVREDICERRGTAPGKQRRVVEEAVFRTIVDSAINPFGIVADDGTVVWAGHSIEELTGWAPDALVGRNMIDVLDEQSQLAVIDSFARFTETAAGGPDWLGTGLLVNVVTPAGEVVPCVASSATSTRTGVPGMVIQLTRASAVTHLHDGVRAMSTGGALADVLGHLADMVATEIAGATVEIGWGWDGTTFAHTAGPDIGVLGVDDHRPGVRPWKMAISSGQACGHERAVDASARGGRPRPTARLHRLLGAADHDRASHVTVGRRGRVAQPTGRSHLVHHPLRRARRRPGHWRCNGTLACRHSSAKRTTTPSPVWRTGGRSTSGCERVGRPRSPGRCCSATSTGSNRSTTCTATPWATSSSPCSANGSRTPCDPPTWSPATAVTSTPSFAPGSSTHATGRRPDRTAPPRRVPPSRPRHRHHRDRHHHRCGRNRRNPRHPRRGHRSSQSHGRSQTRLPLNTWPISLAVALLGRRAVPVPEGDGAVRLDARRPVARQR